MAIPIRDRAGGVHRDNASANAPKAHGDDDGYERPLWVLCDRAGDGHHAYAHARVLTPHVYARAHAIL